MRSWLAPRCVVLFTLWCWAAGIAAHVFGSPQSRQVSALEYRALESLQMRYRRDGDERALADMHVALNNPHAWLTRRGQLYAAWLAQAEHRFADAAARLAPMLASRQDGAIWLMLANLHRISGHHAAARRACEAAALDLPVVVALACKAHVAVAEQAASATRPQPDLQQTLVRLEALTGLAGALPDNPALAAWVHGVLAELGVAVGRLAVSAAHLERELELFPTAHGRAALARVRIRAGDAAGALDLIPEHTTVPALVLARLAALDALGALADHQTRISQLHAQFQRDIARGDLRHGREMAYFYHEIRPQPALAHRLALANWRSQKEPEDAWLLRATAGAPATLPVSGQ